MSVSERKNQHLALCSDGDVEHRDGTLLDEVHLLHESLPEAALDEVDLSDELFGRAVRSPILIAGMTGGTEEARRVNTALAAAAQKHGLGMGLGSQRAMLIDPDARESYRVRAVAPDIPLLANLGLVQARQAGPERVASMVREVGADAICIHLNAAQELVQDEGDRDFRGGLDCLEELAATGVHWVDVSGAGGTSWTRVESLRGSSHQRSLGRVLSGWGVPTAASVVFARRNGLETIASGGIRDGLDAARALVLGARAVAAALPFLRAFRHEGEAGLSAEIDLWVGGLRAVTLLSGALDVRSLRSVPRVLGPRLRSWLDEASLGHEGPTR